MNIAVYTLTRDRLAYTQQSFASLREKAGQPYRHFVYDNGSQDGTRDWLMYCLSYYYSVRCEPDNAGISVASNECLKTIFNCCSKVDLIIKMDNDCRVVSPNILTEFARIYDEDPEAQKWVLAPRVEGIVHQPRRARTHQLAGHEIGVTAIVGGIFHVVPAPIYREFMEAGGYPEDGFLAAGQDDFLCEWLRQNRISKGYVEDLVVEHIDGTNGQAAKYPEYFERKWREEKERPVKT